MQRTYHMSGYTLGQQRTEPLVPELCSRNKHASTAAAPRPQKVAYTKLKPLSPKVASEVKRRGLRRIAGNVFICDSSRDFWNVTDGKIIRLTLTEVDHGETMAAAPRNNPSAFIDQALATITF